MNSGTFCKRLIYKNSDVTERHASQNEDNNSIVPAAGQPTIGILQGARHLSMKDNTINVVAGNQDNRAYHYYGFQQDIINKLNPSTSALHEVGQRAECIEGTRKEILDNIMNWAGDGSSTTMTGYWMCGMAGTGKSTIAQSVCLGLKRKGLLGGEFFCSRQIEECHDYHKVIPTIAYQLASRNAKYQQALCDVLNEDLQLASKEPQYQVTKLLIDPWKRVVSRGESPFLAPVIVIDALDECRDISLVLEFIVPAIKKQELPGLKFFLTSRPEQHIKKHFDLDAIQQERLYVQKFYLHNVEKSIVKKDISLFLGKGLIGLGISKDKLDILVERSGALFIYAATLVKYLASGSEVEGISVSPDGTRIVSGSKDGTVRIWDAQTGTAIGEPFQGHEEWVQSVAFSPDGARIVSGSDDRTVRIWDAQTGTAIGEPLQGHESSVQSVAFSPDGARIVSGSGDRTVRIWDAQTGTAIGEPLQGHKSSVESVAFSPDGARIVSGSGDTTVRIWDAQTGTAIGEPLQGHEYWVQSVAFSPDGARIVSGSDDRTGEPLQGHQKFVQSVAFSSSGAQILSGSSDRAVTNPRTGPTLSCKYNNWTIDKDGWIQFPGIHCGIVWIQPQYCPTLCTSQNPVIISRKGCTKLSFDEIWDDRPYTNTILVIPQSQQLHGKGSGTM
ncbi:hypothetical protein D9758_017362 [Tetrapyrgos nigripes]|uniref:Nephrocystin 3-like N-terminal domain-containing protein n=1 Tax=Tetrapyrgos nigripes TaxID=182062 RepID=A0A8H5C3T3_9AGAR|nr:hypothetical protein D9758_017362 [Tetrapyrgos nigripes]